MNLLIITLVLILALVAHRFSDKFGLPSLLLFILLGMSFNLLGYNFLSDIEFRNGGNIRVIDDGENIDLSKIYFEKINGKNNSEYKFDLKNYTFGHFEKGIE